MIAIAPPDITDINNYTNWLDKNKFPYTILRPDESPLHYSALLLCGGKDINSKKTPLRNILERRWFKEAYGKIHVIGICRGLELANVCLGGTLKDIPNHINENDTCFHNINIDDKIIKVNSHHTKGIDILAPSLIVEGISEDNSHEMIKGEKSIFIQWHPEKEEVWGTDAEQIISSYIKSNIHLSSKVNKERQIFEKIVNYLYAKGFTSVSRERVFKSIDTSCNNIVIDNIVSLYPLKNILDKDKKPALKLLSDWKLNYNKNEI